MKERESVWEENVYFLMHMCFAVIWSSELAAGNTRSPFSIESGFRMSVASMFLRLFFEFFTAVMHLLIVTKSLLTDQQLCNKLALEAFLDG